MKLSPRPLLALNAAFLLFGCQTAQDSGAWSLPETGGDLGASCDVMSPCQSQWLCLDGYCVARAWPEHEPSARAEEPFDVDGGVSDEAAQDTTTPTDTWGDAGLRDASDMDSESDIGAAEARDVVTPRDVFSDAVDGDDAIVEVAEDALEWVMDVETVTDGVLSEDGVVEDALSPPVSDVGPVEVSDGADTQDAAVEDSGGGVVIPPPKKVVFLVAEDSWELGVAAPTLIPEQGQGWVTQLDAPSEGSLLGIQVMMGEPFGASSCGLFRVALWFPFGGGEFNAYPSWIAAQPISITSHDEPYVWLIDELPSVPEGPFLLGLIVDDPCEVNVPRPALLSDTSEGEGGTWLYSVDAGVSALVPADFFGVTGRWVLRALIEVELE
ncbi:MAG: hypothetical protein ACPGU1_09265 [Myxococcota bacterium]